MSVTRRDFLGYACTAAACAGFGGAVAAVAPDDALLRPPGAQDAGRFFGACIRCDRCRSICPEGIVTPSTLFEGALGARTPKLDFHRGYCTFCDLCKDACPTGAIVGFDESSQKIGMAVIQPSRCLAFSAGCRICVDECEYGALSLDDEDIPVVDPAVCNGCGKCVSVCPALVFRTYRGGRVRGVEVVSLADYERIGSTRVDLEGGDGR